MAINATAIWRARPSGNNLNGGGYDASISGATTDYSQSNSPHVAFNGTTVTATTTGISTTIAITGYTVATTDVGNCLQVASGTNFIAGFYFIMSVNTGLGTWTLDRNCTSGIGAGMVGRMGGGWADFFTNTTANIVAGNIIYILGSGLPNASSYTYDYVVPAFFTSVSGDQSTGGLVKYIGDPATPSSGFPCIQTPGLAFYNSSNHIFQNLWFVASASTFGSIGILGVKQTTAIGCTFDQFGYDVSASGNDNVCGVAFINCEVTSSVSARATNANAGITNKDGDGQLYFGNNVHDCLGVGIALTEIGQCVMNVIAKNGGTGLTVNTAGNANFYQSIVNNTIDGNVGNGIEFVDQTSLAAAIVFNNSISNHTQSGTFGIKVDAGTAAQNDRVKAFVDYNTFYNNTTNYTAISAGSHDTAAGSTPYVSEATNNWTLNSAFFGAGTTPASALPQRITGWNG